jgi:hypothetical protein
MEGHGERHAGGTSKLSRLPCRQVSLAPGMIDVLVQEHRLDEQQVGAASELDQAPPVGSRAGDVADVADHLPWREREHAPSQFAERQHAVVAAVPVAPVHAHRRLVRGGLLHQRPQSTEPGSGRQSQRLETVLPDVNVDAFLEPEAETRDPVVESGAAQAEIGLLEQEARLGADCAEVLAPETAAAAVAGPLQPPLAVRLGNVEHELERVPVHEVPGVGRQPMTHLRDETRRPPQPQARVTTQPHA